MSNYQTNQLGLLACLRKVWFPTLLAGYSSRCTFLYLYVICALYTYTLFFYILYKVSICLEMLNPYSFELGLDVETSLLPTSTFYLRTARRVHSLRTNSNMNTWHVYLQSVPPDSCAKIM